MYTIIMTNDKQLATTVRTTLYQKDNLVDKIQFLFPLTYESLELAECDVCFNCTDQSNTIHNISLVQDEEQYKDKLRYHFSVCSSLTKFAGDIVGHVIFTYTDEESGETHVLHTGETTITIAPTSDYGTDTNDGYDNLDQRIDSIEEKVNQLYELVEESMGIKRVSDFDAIADAMADDSIKTIVLENDIECEVASGICLDSGTEKTFNLNGYDVTGICDQGSDVSAAAFYVTDGVLTIEGDGNVLGGRGCHSDVAVWAHGADAKIIIKGGSYNTDVDYQGDYSDVIYANANGAIEIYDGYFDNESHSEYTGPQRYVLNIQNNSGATITCYGGSYVDQNPADGDDKDTATGTTFLAEGYEVIAQEENDHVIYTVIKSE